MTDPDILAIALMEKEESAVVMQLFPSAIARLMAGVEWAKSHPDASHVEIVLHGEKPNALVMTMPRAALLSLAADMSSVPQDITLQ